MDPQPPRVRSTAFRRHEVAVAVVLGRAQRVRTTPAPPCCAARPAAPPTARRARGPRRRPRPSARCRPPCGGRWGRPRAATGAGGRRRPRPGSRPRRARARTPSVSSPGRGRRRVEHPPLVRGRLAAQGQRPPRVVRPLRHDDGARRRDRRPVDANDRGWPLPSTDRRSIDRQRSRTANRSAASRSTSATSTATSAPASCPASSTQPAAATARSHGDPIGTCTRGGTPCSAAKARTASSAAGTGDSGVAHGQRRVRPPREAARRAQPPGPEGPVDARGPRVGAHVLQPRHRRPRRPPRHRRRDRAHRHDVRPRHPHRAAAGLHRELRAVHGQFADRVGQQTRTAGGAARRRGVPRGSSSRSTRAILHRPRRYRPDQGRAADGRRRCPDCPHGALLG